MPPQRAKQNKPEKVTTKTAAEFFSEHQHIAGFDNPWKSLFTSIRELMENSLDAAEAIQELPNIAVRIKEYSQSEFNVMHGIEIPVTDTSEASGLCFYEVTCKDNGCGMQAESIGNMLGRVLSGSKHGMRQTRGKFGLGAKMALIWAKKSTGLPVTVQTAHRTDKRIPTHTHTCTLDMDIYKNEPRVLASASRPNTDNFVGTEMTLHMGGNFPRCRSKVLQYFQQLAVITPYANLTLSFECARDSKKDFFRKFDRRSEQVPPLARSLMPHPLSLNIITLQRLLELSTQQTLLGFLQHDLSGLDKSASLQVISDMSLDEDTEPTSKKIKVSQLLQVLKSVKGMKNPDAHCLSPAGEYNLRLGVLKELDPIAVATFRDRPSSHEGHPFIVEAAVSLGGKNVREGINVFRFANRIPLLFEAGGDVVTQTANTKINWGNYRMNPQKDSVCVFVSIVSTKIPFKGTSKEYIGDDIEEFRNSVKRAIQGCAKQLKIHITRLNEEKEQKERRSLMLKYIPDVIFAVTDVARKILRGAANTQPSRQKRPLEITTNTDQILTKKQKEERMELIAAFDRGDISDVILKQKLQEAVEKAELETSIDVSTLMAKDSDEPFHLPLDVTLPSIATDLRDWDTDSLKAINTRAQSVGLALVGGGTIYLKRPPVYL